MRTMPRGGCCTMRCCTMQAYRHAKLGGVGAAAAASAGQGTSEAITAHAAKRRKLLLTNKRGADPQKRAAGKTVAGAADRPTASDGSALPTSPGQTPGMHSSSPAKGLPEKLGDQPLRLIIVGHNPSETAWQEGRYYAHRHVHLADGCRLNCVARARHGASSTVGKTGRHNDAQPRECAVSAAAKPTLLPRPSSGLAPAAGQTTCGAL